MLPQFPTLIVRFDIHKIHSAAYGFQCWKILCGAGFHQMRSILLFEGDSAGTLSGRENIFCIGFQSLIQDQFGQIQTRLRQHPEFLKVAAVPPFLEGPDAANEPLVSAGRIDATGQLSNDADSAREALAAIEKTQSSK